MKRKKPGYYCPAGEWIDNHREGIGERLGSDTSDLVTLVAFQWVDRAIEELDNRARGGYCLLYLCCSHTLAVNSPPVEEIDVTGLLTKQGGEGKA